MSPGKGKAVATTPDWKDKLAMLDQEMGWDDESGSDWAESGPSKTHQSTQNEDPSGNTINDFDYAADYNAAESLDGNDTHYDVPAYLLDDDPTTTLEMQQSLWDTAVMGANKSGENDNQPEHDAGGPSEDTSSDGSAYEEDDHVPFYAEQHTNQCVELNCQEASYCYYHYGEEYHYQARCWCHAYLADPTAERNKQQRAYYETNGTVLLQDPCALLPYPQEPLPGTENVVKPIILVTTPEGENLFPHDLQEYPDPAVVRERPVSGGLPAQGGYLVPYEDEDSPDF
ncbi:hypothetical protein Daus18300_012861 [Diaporthe australafricana]|uniref:Uncharacterized protein n=1 Tax=Diaporthe australafricana TaxID=127596 RepID=A0ABR3W183_9PEZI